MFAILNHNGSAGSMEPKGAVQIFARYETERDLRYMEYLGDGDSSSFLKVKESKPHGEDLVTKSECIVGWSEKIKFVLEIRNSAKNLSFGRKRRFV